MATRGSLQQLLASIQHARSGQVGAPTPPPGVNPPPANSYRPAQFYREDGHPAYAAQLWMSRHPFAVQNGQIPHWVTQAMHGALGSGGHQNPFTPNPGTPNPVMTPHQGAPAGGTPNLGFGHYSGAGAALGGPDNPSPDSAPSPGVGTPDHGFGYSPAPGTGPNGLPGVGPDGGPFGGYGGSPDAGIGGGSFGPDGGPGPRLPGGPLPLGPPVNGAPPNRVGAPIPHPGFPGPNQLAAQQALNGYA